MKVSLSKKVGMSSIDLEVEGEPEDVAFILDITGNTVDFPAPSSEADDKDTVH